MPNAPRRPCGHPGCPELVESGRCEKHRLESQRHYDAQRGGSTERGYDRWWRKFREWFLARHPLCECSYGAQRGLLARPRAIAIRCGKAAVDVHHLRRIQDGGPRLSEANCQALCHEHHASLRGSGGWL